MIPNKATRHKCRINTQHSRVPRDINQERQERREGKIAFSTTDYLRTLYTWSVVELGEDDDRLNVYDMSIQHDKIDRLPRS